MSEAWMVLTMIATTVGLPMLVLGVISRLAEVSFAAKGSGRGSGRLMLWGCVLCLPLACRYAPSILSELVG